MLDQIVTRLQIDAFAAVEIAEDIQSIPAKATAAEDGTVFVVPWRERAQPNRNAVGTHRQRVDVQFVTALVIRQHDDPRGSERALRFETMKAAVEDRLAGWQPLSGGVPCSLIGGEATGFGNGVSIFAQTWQTARFLTGAPHA